MKRYNEYDFINLIRGNIKPLSKQEFLKTPYIKKLWDKLDDEDIRKKYFNTVEDFYIFIYEFMTNDAPLVEYFKKRLSFKEVTPIKNVIIKDKTINNVPNNTRLLRNINLPSILDCTQDNGNSIKNIYKNTLEYGFNPIFLTVPSVIKDVIKNDLNSLIPTLKTQAGTVSIFSTNTYFSLLKYTQKYVNNTEVNTKVLIPTASWCSPIIAGRYTKYKEIHILDVQKEVLNVCEDLYEYTYNDFFDEDLYTLKTFCNPSETMSTVVDDDYDLIFFCPPYYDLEVYGGSEEQSTTLYKSYEEWLRGYWEETVKESYKVLKEKGVFSFTIGNIIKNKSMGKDLLEIAKQYFIYKDEIKITQVEEITRIDKSNKYEICYILKKE